MRSALVCVNIENFNNLSKKSGLKYTFSKLKR